MLKTIAIHTLVFVLMSICSMSLTWVCFAFIEMNGDPESWGKPTRACYVVVVAILAVVLTMRANRPVVTFDDYVRLDVKPGNNWQTQPVPKPTSTPPSTDGQPGGGPPSPPERRVLGH